MSNIIWERPLIFHSVRSPKRDCRGPDYEARSFQLHFSILLKARHTSRQEYKICNMMKMQSLKGFLTLIVLVMTFMSLFVHKSSGQLPESRSRRLLLQGTVHADPKLVWPAPGCSVRTLGVWLPGVCQRACDALGGRLVSLAGRAALCDCSVCV